LDVVCADDKGTVKELGKAMVQERAVLAAEVRTCGGINLD
jgi:hypothetical protein